MPVLPACHTGLNSDVLPGSVHRQWVATLDAIRDPIFVIDRSDRLVRMNKAFAELAAASFAELLQRRVVDVVPWFSAGHGQRFIKLQIAPDGRMFQLRDFPIGSPPADRIVIMEDVTSQRALERIEDQHRDDSTLALVDTLETICAAMQIKDPFTAIHGKRIARLAWRIALNLGYDEEQARGIFLGATIHDLGIMYVPSGILNRPGKLVQAELNLIRMHPETGFSVIRNLTFPWPVHEIVLQHHERMNGSGYPAGLKGEAISFAARIVAVADVVEAMTSHRPYRAALGIDAALEEIRRNCDILYDADVAQACLNIFDGANDEVYERRMTAETGAV